MSKRYALKTERIRKHPKTGEPFQDVSFYKGPFHGIAHEWTSDPAEARIFSSKNLAEVYARNKGIRFDAVVRL